MENYKTSTDFLIERWPREFSPENIKKALLEMEGVIDVKITGQKLHVEYYQHLLSRNQIIERTSRDGYSIQTQKHKKGFLSKYLEKVAESNRKQFGNKPLDCCKLKK